MNRISYLLLLGFFLSESVAGSDGPLPVIPAKNQQAFLKSGDQKLASNKKIVYDFYRIVLFGRRLGEAPTFMRVDYIQHNPNVDTGMKGFTEFFGKLGPPRGIPDELPDLVAIQAEGDYVTLSFASRYQDPAATKGTMYSTTSFDMFRIQDGKIAEHWDGDFKSGMGK